MLERLRAHADALFDTAFEGLDDAARRQLGEALARIRDNLQAEQKEMAHG